MKLSVVIPCLNAAGTIATQLEALANQQWAEPWEIIVSDNGSKDGTLAIAEQYQEKLPHLQLVDASGCRGAAHARNVGVLAAQSDLLAFCDADDMVAQGWVAAIAEAVSKFDFVASSLEWEELNANWILQSMKLRRNGVGIYSGFLPAAASWGIGIRRSIHESIGGFDETMLRLQDVDYCWRVQLTGVKLHSVSNAVVHYRFPNRLSDIYHKARLTGEYEVLLYKRYGSLGMPRPGLKASLRRWTRLITSLPAIRSRQEGAKWVRGFGYCLGRLQGSLKYRVFIP